MEDEEKSRVLMLLSNPFTHDPRVYKEAKSLTDIGYDVVILAMGRNKHLPSAEMKDGISVVMVPIPSLPFRLPTTIELLLWWHRCYRCALHLHKKKHFHFIHAHDLDTLPIGVKLKRRVNLPLVYDSHEIYGYMVGERYPKIVVWMVFLIERFLLRYVDHIITVNEPLMSYFKRITKKPITVIENCNHVHMPVSDEEQHNKKEHHTIAYIGRIERNRYITEILEAVSDLHGVQCIVGGDGDQDYIDELKYKYANAENIKFIGEVPLEKAMSIVASSDIVIRLSNPTNMNDKVGLPNKIFEAIAWGKPIIVTRDTYCGEFVKSHCCGLITSNEVPDIRKSIVELIDNPKLREELAKNGLIIARERYNWKIKETQLLSIYESLKRYEGAADASTYLK